MNHSRWEAISNTIRSYIKNSYFLVGVKIITEDQQITKIEAESQPTMNCKALKEVAREGKIIKIEKENEQCPTALLSLGYVNSTSEQQFDKKVKSIILYPLHQTNLEPDVILTILKPNQVSEFTLLLELNKNNGKLKVEFKGKAACGDYLAIPYLKKRINLSFMCPGARLYGGFKDDEIVLGAPPEVFIEVYKRMKKAAKIGASLCGCRTNDMPDTVRYIFESNGFSKGIDYFFGEIENRQVRVYLNKDFKGNYNLITVHLPIRTESPQSAGKLSEKLKTVLKEPYVVKTRGNWVDVTLTGFSESLGLDLTTGLNFKQAIKKIISKVIHHIK
ncbi:MAG: DUF169 domain-containing protein [Candidatus Odinarchaeia archaeon]